MPRTRFNNGVLGPRQTTSATAAAGIFGLVDHQVLTGGGVFPRSPNAGPITDPYFNYVTALLPGDGTNGAQNNTFLDSSANNFTITRTGNTTQGTFTPFSQTGWSNYFDGTGDYLTAPSNAAFALGTGDFTIEGWFFMTTSTDNALWGIGDGTTSGGVMFRYEPASTRFNFYNTGDILFTGAAVTSSNWHHIAVVRSSGTLRVYLNGTQYGSSVSNSTNIAQNIFYIGGGKIGATVPYNPHYGYISNLRVVKGTALYTSSFTPSTTPLTAIANTSLLTCQSNRFIDNSTNNFTVTKTGDVSVLGFGPFSPTAAYTTTAVGGSAYFNGSLDYLDIAHNSLLTPAGNFTIEFWAYVTESSGTQEWYSKGYGIQIYIQTNWGVALSASNDSTYFVNYAGTPVITNTWTHVALTRSGTTYRFFINGVEVFSTTSSSAPSTGTNVLRLGDWSGSAAYPAKGNMAAVRFVDGTALYTANFTPPSTPPTAVANTQFLCNFTNAGITDATAKNIFETIGQAQISTTQSKFGGSSILFDGSGDWLQMPPSPMISNWYLGDYTVEYWIYPNAFASSTNGGSNVFSQAAPATSGEYFSFGPRASGVVVFYYYNGAPQTITSGTISTGTWTHLAATYEKSSNTLRIFINGTLTTSSTISGTPVLGPADANALILVGASASAQFNGYIDDLRVTTGIARYTSTFTPPTSAFALR